MIALQVLNEHTACAGQLLIDDISLLAEQGVQTIICNRPDGEEPQQVPFADIQQAAQHNGITCIYAPIAGGNMSPDVLHICDQHLSDTNKTVMYCKSGMRSSIAYAIIQVRRGNDINTVINQVSASGHDIRAYADIISHYA